MTFMLYYGLFSCDLHILDLQWRLPNTFCGDYSWVQYFYVTGLIMASQWVMMLLWMPQCGITMGDDVVMNASLWHHNGWWCCYECLTVASQWVMMLPSCLSVASQWVMMLPSCLSVASQWVMTLLGTSIVTSQWLIMLIYVLHNA